LLRKVKKRTYTPITGTSAGKPKTVDKNKINGTVLTNYGYGNNLPDRLLFLDFINFE